MAIESERLLAIFEAKFSSLEKALSKARKDANKTFGDIETAGSKAETALARVGSRGTPGIDKATKSMKSLQGQTGNLAAQINDIGVQLASGTSPFLIAVQQGSQINQVIGQAGARGAVQALGGAFFSLLNPVSLATFAIIGLGGVAVQYFTSLFDGGEKSAKVLKEEAALVQRVADKWGEALPALQAYAEEKQRLADIKDVETATASALDDAWKQARDEIGKANVAVAKLRGLLQPFGKGAMDLKPLNDAFETLREKVDNGTATVDDLKTVSSALSTLFQETQIPIVANLAKEFDALAAQIAKASAESAKFTGQKAKFDLNAQFEKNLKNSTLPKLDPLGFIDTIRDQNNIANATKSQTQLAAEKAAKQAGSAAKTNPYLSGVQTIKDRTKALEAMTQAQASINPLIDDYGYAITKARITSQLLADAERAHMKITPDLRASIDALATGYANATVQRNQLTDAQNEARRTAQDLANTERDALGGFIKDLVHGKSAADALSDALGKIGDKLLDLALNDLFDPKGGGGFLSSLFRGGGKGGLLGGILIPGILHSGGVAGKDGYGTGRAVSTGIFANAPRYHEGGIAGLKPGELPAILQKGEIIIPKAAARGSSAGSAITYAPVYNVAQGADPAAIAALRKAQAEDRAQFQSKVVRAIADARRHNVQV